MDTQTLNISKATMYDAGVYTCVIENSLGNLSRSFQLIVQGRSLDRPVFISKSSNSTQYEGDNVTLECHFYSDSSPFVQWFVRRRSLTTERDTSTNELEFLKVISYVASTNISSLLSKYMTMNGNPIYLYSFLMDQDLV
jgi:hypothetical protein